jgi:cytochrome b involved in lipid metabolism
MSSYLPAWLTRSAIPAPLPDPILRISPPPDIDIDSDHDQVDDDDEYDDAVPAFPAMNSIQRSGGGLMLPPSTTSKPKPRSKKVALAPGFGQLDWAKRTSSGEDLRGVDTLLRVKPSMLKEHRKRDDAWTAINGKVYNMTAYLPYHPGGEKELMRVAGRDGTKLFAETHGWVNIDFMLDTCMVGFLVPE